MFFNESDISLDILGVFKLKRGEMSRRAAVARNYDSLSIRTNGRGFFETDSGKLSVKKGDVLYIPKNAKYAQTTSGESVIAVHFINYTFDKNSGIEKIRAEDAEYVEATLKNMYDVWKEKKQGYRYKCIALLYELLYVLNCQEHNKRFDGPHHDYRIKKAVDYIHHNFRSEQIEVSFLAEMCLVSETYFRKLFKEFYSVSPKQYIMNLRLETAIQLLQSQLYSVSEVCAKSGFTDSKYFAKLFKNRYGRSPKAFAKEQTL